MPMSERKPDVRQREASSHKNTSTSRRRILHLLGAGGVVGLTGCSADSGGEGTKTTGTSTDTATNTGKELQPRATIAIPSNPTQDWHTVYGVTPYWHRMLEPLTWCTPDLKAKPWLATDWKRTGEKTWEFYLREDVTFHNGDPLTAEAVVHSYKKFLTGTPFNDYWQEWSQLQPGGIEKVDDKTVKFTNSSPFPNLPERLTHLVWGVQHPESAKNQKWGGVIGTGPYKFKSIKHDKRVTVSSYDNYWKSSPKMEELTFRWFKDRNTRALALMGGEVDVGMTLSPSSFKRIEKANKTNATAQEEPRTAIMNFNNTKSPTDDVKLRKALNYVVSQKKVIDGALSGIGTPAKGLIPPMIWYSAHDSLPAYGPDKAKAKQLVNESKYNGETLKLLSSTEGRVTENPELAAQIVRQQAKEVGVDIEIKMLEPGAYSKAESKGKGGHIFQQGVFTAHALSYDLFIDYTTSWQKHPFSFDKEQAEKLDSLHHTATTADTPKEAKEAFGKLQRIIVEDLAIMIPLYYKKYIMGTDAKVKSFDWHPIKRYNQWEKLELMK